MSLRVESLADSPLQSARLGGNGPARGMNSPILIVTATMANIETDGPRVTTAISQEQGDKKNWC